MGLLAQWLMTAFASLLGFFAQWVTKKTALGLTMITVIAGLTSALYLLLKGLVAGLAATIVNKWVLIGMSIIWPSNAEACISAMFACDVAVWLYREHVANIKAMAYIT